MFCKNCGASLEENDAFCKNCGTAVVKEEVKEVPTQEVAEQPVQTVQEVVEQPVQTPVQPNVEQVQRPVNNTATQQKASSVNKSGVIVVCIICGIIALFLILGLVVVIGLASITVGNSIETIEDGRTKLPSEESTSNLTNTSSKTSSTYKVSFGGFDFRVPDNLVYDKDEDALYIANEDETWMAQIEVIELSYSQLKSNKSQLKSIYEEEGYTSSAAKEVTAGGVDYIYNELTYSGTNFIAAMAKANSMNTFCISVLDIDNEFNVDVLEEIASIIDSAEYTGTTSNKIESNVSIDFSRLNEIGQ